MISDKTQKKIVEVYESNTEVFSDLTRVAGLNPAFDFTFADLRDVDFSYSDLRGYNFFKADLSNTNWNKAIYDGTTIVEKANISGANIDTSLINDFKVIRANERTSHDSGGRPEDPQRTLATQVTLTGVGVHSGKPASITLVPAEAGVGVVFIRTDCEDGIEIPALWNKVSATALCTVLGDPSKNGVSSVDHLMAALSGMGVDNLIVEIDGPEVPVMDGSSAIFVEAIEQVGLKRLDRSRRYLKVKKPVRVDAGDAWCELHPHDTTRLDITIDFDTPLIGRQQFSSDITPNVFRDELSRARTFGYVKDVEQLWKMGFALGSSLENSIAISEDKVLNPEGIRWPDEFARHKTLDAVGNLALAGLPVLGLYRSYKGGHKMNHAILVKLFEDQSAFEVVSSPRLREVGQNTVSTFEAVPTRSA